ncbi:hypothetical protein [Streptomyces europaeiscabiei]|uniref:hypothetical protein n=1 Tax=Streptomyces europaeiscabiei TaxID=146819 RepID=UPI0038F5FBC8
MSVAVLTYRGVLVPYVVPWKFEKPFTSPLVLQRGPRGPRIGYKDENPAVDRHDGVLYVRQPIARGVGRPDFPNMHSRRQRRAMIHMLCQVRGGSTFGRPDERHLFLMRSPGGRPITEGEKTTAAPVCVPCAVESVSACPHLRDSYAAALVGYYPSWGVAGVVYDPSTLQPLPSESNEPLEHVAHNDPRLPWTVAARYVISLHDVTPVDLADLASLETAPAGCQGRR